MNPSTQKLTSEALNRINLSRYYANAYASAERSDKLDPRLFANLGEQKEYFAGKLADARKSLRGDLFALRAMCVEALRNTQDAADKATLAQQIEVIDGEMTA